VVAPRGTRRVLRLTQEFRERQPDRAMIVRIKLPKVAMSMGYLESVNYVTTLGDRTVRFKHTFAKGSRPLLAASGRKNQLLIVGGRFHVTERGIVDLGPSGREIDDRGYRSRR
jgi:hypothetical protein